MVQAAQLRQVARALEGFADRIADDQVISVSVGIRDLDEVHVHGTQPEVLEIIERELDPETVSEDADGITRYVTVKTDTLEVTWHRR